MLKNLKKGTVLTDKNSYLAFPLQKNQFPANQIKRNMILKSNVNKDQPIVSKCIQQDIKTVKELDIWQHIHNVRGILNENKIAIGKNFEMEISHHDGLKNFKKVGCYLFNLINKEYAKKLLLCFPIKHIQCIIIKLRMKLFIF